jgi:hypothetical protein
LLVDRGGPHRLQLARGFRATLLGNMLRFSVTNYSTGTNHQLSLLTGDNELKLRN